MPLTSVYNQSKYSPFPKWPLRGLPLYLWNSESKVDGTQIKVKKTIKKPFWKSSVQLWTNRIGNGKGELVLGHTSDWQRNTCLQTVLNILLLWHPFSNQLWDKRRRLVPWAVQTSEKDMYLHSIDVFLNHYFEPFGATGTSYS